MKTVMTINSGNSSTTDMLYRVAFAVLCLLMFSAAVDAQQSCQTPVNAEGVCIPAAECPLILKMTDRYGSHLPPSFVDYLKKSVCQPNVHTGKTHICCPNTVLNSRPTTGTQPLTTSIDSTANNNVQQTIIANPRYYVSSLDREGINILGSLKCGIPSDERVAFGEDAMLAEFPWMALLEYDHPTNKFQCGGSLITNRYVLTAAHCIRESTDTLKSVRLGEHNIATERDCVPKGRKEVCSPPVEDFGIQNVIVHPEYNRRDIINDIALIKLDRAVDFKKHIKPVCLPITESSLTLGNDLEFFIAGWGVTENSTTSNILQKGKITYVPLPACRKIYTRVHLSENHICAGGTNRTDSCRADSGGPLFKMAQYMRTSRYIQFGVVSFGGYVCGTEKTYPGLYANVANLMPWITTQIAL